MDNSIRISYAKSLLCAVILAAYGTGAFAQALKPVAQKISERKSQQTFSKVSLFSISTASQQRNAELSNVVSNASVMEFNSTSARQIVSSKPGNISFAIPANGSTVELELYRVNLFTPDFSVVTSGNNGQPVAYNGGVHYWGIIHGDNTSLAAISIYDNEVMGLISSPALGNLVLGKLENDPLNRHIFYNDRNLNAAPPTTCFTENDNRTYDEKDLQNPGARVLTNCIRLYWEVNLDIYNGKGSVGNAANYVIGLFSQSSIIYANDGIPVELSQVYVWNTTSPYTSTSTSGLLGQFQSNRNSFNGNLGHLLGYAGGGGIAAGFSGFCSANLDNSQCYSGIQSSYSTVPTYSWSVMVVTHEQGHLMGSRHTHACVWNGNNTAIDNCGPNAGYGYEGSCSGAPTPVNGGTIMSYCHLTVGINFSNGFGTQPKNVILNNYNNAGCLTSCSGSSVASSISTSNISPTAICAGNNVNVSYALNASASAGNVFTAQLSNSTGSFSTPTSIGTLSSTSSGTITATIPVGTTGGSAYRIRVVASNPVITGNDNGVNLTINPKPVPSITGNTSFCAGTSTILNAGSGYSNYSWSTGATSQTITVSTANTFTVTVTSNGCTGSTSLSTTVNANPVPSISGNLAFCEGILTQLDAGAGYANYVWSTGANTQTISVSTAGTFTVTVTNGNGCTGSASATTTVTALPAQPASIVVSGGIAKVCPGETRTYTTTSVNGVTYDWILPTGGTINSGQGTNSISVTYDNNFTATGTLSVTGSNTCGSGIPRNLTVNRNNPTATITTDGPTTFCSGTNPLTLTANAGAGLTYQWKKGANNVSGATAQSYVPTSTATSYKVIVTNASGCSKTSAAVAVTVNPLPAAIITPQGPTTFCAGGSVVLSANSGAGLTYQWRKGANLLAGETLQDYTATLGGYYRVIVTDANTCSKTSTATVVTINCRLADAGNDVTQFDLFPNPASGEITLTYLVAASENYQMQLLDLSGRVLSVTKGSFTQGTNMLKYNLSSFDKGVYILKLQTETKNFEQKIVLQ